MAVPFLDLKKNLAGIRSEVDAAVTAALDQCAFAGGPFVAQFEEEFAAYCGTAHCVGVGSGTEALWLALLALDVGPGDEVITSPMTFIATGEAITFAGATPVFVDILDEDSLLDPSKIEAAITERTKAIIPVHLFGQVADMNAINAVAQAHGIPVIEDAAQAHGATQEGRKAGSLGRVGCFSFYPGKNLGAIGEAGAIVTDDETLAKRVDQLRNHGQIKKYDHAIVGWNGRMDGVQAAALSVKLRHLDAWTESRRRAARAYHQGLGGETDIRLPASNHLETSSHHLFPLRLKRRDAMLSALGERGIGVGIHYPEALSETKAYRSLGYPAGSFPVAERSAREFLSLPMFPELTGAQVDEVCHAVLAILEDWRRE